MKITKKRLHFGSEATKFGKRCLGRPPHLRVSQCWVVLRACFRIVILSLLMVSVSVVSGQSSQLAESAASVPTSVYQLLPYPARGQVVASDESEFVLGDFGYQGLNDSAILGCFAILESNSVLTTKGVYFWNGSLLATVSEVLATENHTGYNHLAINNRGDAAYTWYSQSGPTRLAVYSEGTLADLVAVGGEIEPGFGVRALPVQPTINERGDIALLVNVAHPNGGDTYSIYKYTGGRFERVIGQGSEAFGGGRFAMNYGPLPPAWLADNGDILFQAYIIGGPYHFMHGLFVVRAGGTVEKIEIRGDPLPVGGEVHYYSLGNGTLNAVGDAAFRVRIEHPTIDSGIFVSSRGTLSTIMYEGQISPLGGPFLSLYHPTEDDPGGDGAAQNDPPLINSRGQVLFEAEARDVNGTKRFGLFVGTPNCIVKVVAEGDRLPTGGRVLDIAEYSLNEQGQVVVRVRESTPEGKPYAIILATPTPSELTSVKIKGTDDAKRLVIKGSGFVINDAIVEIDGHVVGGVEYSAASSGNDGTTRRLIVRGSELADLLRPGQTVQITVSSPFTGLRSAPFSLSVPNR